MPVTIRLARHGRKNLPYYRVVVADKEKSRDGRYIEHIGFLNPLSDPPTAEIKEDRVKYWLDHGATTSDTVSKYMEKLFPGYLSGIEEERTNKIRSKRAKRKAKAGGKIANPKSEAKASRQARAKREKVIPAKKETPAEEAQSAPAEDAS